MIAAGIGGDRPRVSDARSLLMETYLARRGELRRYFTLRLGSAEAAEDLVQDLYERIERSAPDEIGNPAALLYRMGSNLMLDRLRQERRARLRDTGWRSASTTTIAGEDVAEEPDAEQAASAKLHLERIVEALNDLSPACRRVFRMHKLEGLSHAETAAALGISRSAVEKHIMSALRHLQAKVGRWP